MKITLEGIDGGKQINPVSFSANELDLNNDTILIPVNDMPFFGLQAGQKFKIAWDGEYIRAGGLSWSIEQLIEEIKQGFWKIHK